jgi:U3 small nucleolar RNA-associated protein 10
VVHAGHQSSHLISFWSSITAEAVFGMLENTNSGRRDIQAQKTEELVLRVLPVLNSCMRAKYGPETVAACYTIVTVLVGKGVLGDKVLDGLMEAVVLAHDEETLTACLQCLAVIAEQRSPAQISARVYKKLLAVPQLSQKLLSISKQCHVERLSLGCALGALAKVGSSDEHREVFQDLMGSTLLPKLHTGTALSTLVTFTRDCAPGSEERGHLLELATKLAETPYFLDAMRAAAKANDIDLDSLGLTLGENLESAQVLDVDTDDEMLDVDDEAIESTAAAPQCPEIRVKTFLIQETLTEFSQVADCFEQTLSVAKNKPSEIRQFLASTPLHQKDAMRQSLYLSFLARLWCSARTANTRKAALLAAAKTIKEAKGASDFQNLVPYLTCALADPAQLVRHAAAACITAMSESSQPKAPVWGSSDIYGKASGKAATLKAEDASAMLSSVLVPMLEESIMDGNFAITAIRDVLEGSHKAKDHSKNGLKSQARVSILSFLASHTSLTPLLRVQGILLPIFRFAGKTSDAVRSNTILPTIRQWCSLSLSEAAKACDAESLVLQDVDRSYLSNLLAKETKSIQLLNDIVSGDASKERATLMNISFDQITAFWPKLKPEPKGPLAHTLLQLSFNESTEASDKLRKERAIDALRTVKLDSTTLVALLESVPSAVTMPEGPPAKKRRRTSRNEMARVELSSQDDVQRLLRKLTLVLELIEGSTPGEHPALFRSLFNVFGELQPLRQQSGSELVYLQSIILSSLSPIVDTLKVSTSILIFSKC